jgi:beta-galactosidase
LIAIGSGNPRSDEPYTGNQHHAFQGRLLAIVRSTMDAGEIIVTAQVENLPQASLQLETEDQILPV